MPQLNREQKRNIALGRLLFIGSKMSNVIWNLDQQKQRNELIDISKFPTYSWEEWDRAYKDYNNMTTNIISTQNIVVIDGLKIPSKVMTKYIIQRIYDHKYYKHTKYSGGRWVENLEKAKVYNQLNHAQCAINMMKEYAKYGARYGKEDWAIQPGAFYILVFEMKMIQDVNATIIV